MKRLYKNCLNEVKLLSFNYLMRIIKELALSGQTLKSGHHYFVRSTGIYISKYTNSASIHNYSIKFQIEYYGILEVYFYNINELGVFNINNIKCTVYGTPGLSLEMLRHAIQYYGKK